MKLTLILSLCLMNLICLSQDNETPAKKSSTVSFGIKGGVNIASLKDNQEADLESRSAYHAGFFTHIHLSPVLALQPEVVYSSQGAKYKILGVEKVNYVNIPVLFQYMVPGGLRIQTGPQAGILTSAELKRYSGGEDEIKHQFNSADLSWVFGLGYLSNIGLGVDARYNHGLTNIVNADNHKVFNRVFQFGLFYQFK